MAYQSTASRLFQGVAGVLLGAEALDGGIATVAIGVLMHFGVAFGWSAVFLFLVPRSPWVLRLRASRYGVAKVASLYGPLIWLVMSLVVIPILAAVAHDQPPLVDPVRWAHPFVGLPIVAASGRGSPR